jgi:hypothetical protein
MLNRRNPVLDTVDLLLTELAELRSRGPYFRIYHRFREPGTDCTPGEEILAVCLVHRGRESCLLLSLALRILFDYLARHSRFPQSASQIEAGIRADRFYTLHATAVMGAGNVTRKISRSCIKVYIKRLRSAFENAFRETGLPMEAHTVLLSQGTVVNEVGYRIKAVFEWVHHDV